MADKGCQGSDLLSLFPDVFFSFEQADWLEQNEKTKSMSA